jgi:uncharacterized RDD family membrane protein YckC
MCAHAHTHTHKTHFLSFLFYLIFVLLGIELSVAPMLGNCSTPMALVLNLFILLFFCFCFFFLTARKIELGPRAC